MEDALPHGVAEVAAEGFNGEHGGPGEFFVSSAARDGDGVHDAEAVDDVAGYESRGLDV